MKKNKGRADEELKRLQIRRKYDALIIKTKTIRDCEDILRELVKDQEIPSSMYWDIYWELEARARQIKARQAAILKEAEAEIETTKKMLAHYGK